MQANATRQKLYRTRQSAVGARQLNIYISPDAHCAIACKATADGVSQREVIERLALSAPQPKVTSTDEENP